MSDKPTYEELEQRVRALERAASEHKRIENELKESEKRFSTIFHNSPAAMAMTTLDGNRFIEVNEVWQNLTGYTREEVMGHTAFELNLWVKPEQREKFAEMSRNQDGAQGEVQFRRKSGEIRDILMSAEIVELADEHFWLTMAQDVSARKHAEEALKASEEKYRRIIETTQEGIWMIDNEDKTSFVNAKMAEMLGYTINEMIGEPLFSFMDEEGKKIAARLLERRRQGIPEQHDFKFKRKDDSYAWALLATSPVLDENGQYAGALAMVADITERKRMEEEILKTQKLESLGILAGGIAHDFNNILTTILGNISMAREQVKPGGEIFNLLNEAEMASVRASALTKQLLTFAKGGTPVKEISSITDIIKESSLFVLRGAKSRCEFSIPEDLWVTEVDVGQISQVINNITINANQAMPDGGIIDIKAKNLIIVEGNEWQLNPGKYIRISIKDEGVGIAEKHLSKVFDPYFTTKQEGSGLGLATAYSIIKKHEGNILVESLLGIGTTFHIYLPVSEKASSILGEDKVIEGLGRILVMDDDASLRKMVEKMLSKLGFEPELAENGVEAIRMVKEAKEAQKPYDAVILDLTVPGGMGGKEAISRLLEIDPEIKAIVSSGYSNDAVLANYQEYGFKGMIPKPFEAISLSKVLHEVLKT